LERLLAIYGYVFAAIYNWKKKGAHELIIIDETEKKRIQRGYPSREC
jgi:hypothetical protein